MESKPSQYQYKLAIACMFKYAQFYLKEWIEFHLLIGVEHFFMGNHYCNDDSLTILQPYIDRGIVELEEVKEPFKDGGSFESTVHQPFFNRIIERTRNTVHFLALLDTDEFITPILSDFSTFSSDTVYNMLKEAEMNYGRFKRVKCGGIAINWLYYGNGFIEKLANDEFILEKMIYHEKSDSKLNCHVKSIVIPAKTSCSLTHHASMKNSFGLYSIGGELVTGPFTTKPYLDKLCLVHYGVGDSTFFNKNKVPFYKVYTGDPNSGVLQRADLNIHNDVRSEYMLKFVPLLRERLGEKINLYHHPEEIIEKKEEKESVEEERVLEEVKEESVEKKEETDPRFAYPLSEHNKEVISKVLLFIPTDDENSEDSEEESIENKDE